MIPEILNMQEIKTDFNLKILNFNMGFTSYWKCLESLKNHYPMDSAIHLSYNWPQNWGGYTRNGNLKYFYHYNFVQTPDLSSYYNSRFKWLFQKIIHKELIEVFYCRMLKKQEYSALQV